VHLGGIEILRRVFALRKTEAADGEEILQRQKEGENCGKNLFMKAEGATRWGGILKN